VTKTLLLVHIVTASLAIVGGYTALFAGKGGTLHRRAGMLFVYTMLVMGISASALELLKTPTGPNVLAAFLTAYFVGTALTTVRPVSPWTRRIDVAALGIVLGLALANAVRGAVVLLVSARGGGSAGFALFLFFLSGCYVAAAAGDLRVMRHGRPRGAARLRRHLWRMCFALFVAAASFFSIRERVARILPEPFTTGPMRALPILVLLGAMLYWLWRVRRLGSISEGLRLSSVSSSRGQHQIPRHGRSDVA